MAWQVEGGGPWSLFHYNMITGNNQLCSQSTSNMVLNRDNKHTEKHKYISLESLLFLL